MRIRKGKWTVLIAAMVFCAGSNGFAQDKQMTPLDIPTIGDVEALKPGDAAPSFELKDPAGTPHKVSTASGTAKLFVFWSIFCEPCLAELPLIQAMNDRHNGKGLDVTTIVLDGDMADAIAGFAKKNKYTFTILLDQETPDGALVVADNYRIPGTPTIYVVDKAGKIAFARVGQVSEGELEKAVQAAMGK
jgi:peroxiredoxin